MKIKNDWKKSEFLTKGDNNRTKKSTGSEETNKMKATQQNKARSHYVSIKIIVK